MSEPVRADRHTDPRLAELLPTHRRQLRGPPITRASRRLDETGWPALCSAGVGVGDYVKHQRCRTPSVGCSLVACWKLARCPSPCPRVLPERSPRACWRCGARAGRRAGDPPNPSVPAEFRSGLVLSDAALAEAVAQKLEVVGRRVAHRRPKLIEAGGDRPDFVFFSPPPVTRVCEGAQGRMTPRLCRCR